MRRGIRTISCKFCAIPDPLFLHLVSVRKRSRNWLKRVKLRGLTRDFHRRASSFEVLLSVPQDSLVSVNDSAQIPQELFELAGLYFDRFDQKNPETCQFIPSEPLRLQYPDG